MIMNRQVFEADLGSLQGYQASAIHMDPFMEQSKVNAIALQPKIEQNYLI